MWSRSQAFIGPGGLGKVLGKGLGKVLRARFGVMQSLSLAPVPVPRPGTAGVLGSPVRPPQRHTRGLVGALNAEWSRLATDTVAVSAWALREPVLAGCRSLGDVVAAAGGRGQDDLLRALLRLARDGDGLAARAALQAMLGAAVRLARRTVAHAQGDFEESLSRAVAALWQVVREYPVERRACRPADGISLDVLAVLTGAGRSRPQEVPGGLAGELADVAVEDEDDGGVRSLFWSLTHPRAVSACSDEQLVLLLGWGVRHGVLSLEDARLLLRLNSSENAGSAVSCREVADELGLAHAAVRQRASRATRRLACAVAEHARLALDGHAEAA